ncbi:MAG: SCP2 sterol-binding domain-containing protein [Acidimicrobiaceae bacterium]|nr:SCP2 sterol-binding domain-containing protein [Acidimicrobiaceae bacterium]MBO0747069.1 SCP2 sterol-binding domain-containing protein [Acidimicrobiaceae bacterium]
MAVYLSAEWFQQVREALGPAAADRGAPDIVLRQVVTGTPEGDVSYQVEIRAGHASLVAGTTGDADMTFMSDYPTAVAIARGQLSTQSALLEGRIRVHGNPVALSAHQAAFGHLDPLPEKLRAETTFR